MDRFRFSRLTERATGGADHRRPPLAGWKPWTNWSVPLYAPQAAPPPRLDGIVSLTASRWLEGGSVAPVVFATDRQGNIYVTHYVNGQWQPWRSFYN